MNKDVEKRSMEIGSQEIIEDRVEQLLSKLPQICPKLKKVSNTTQLDSVLGKEGNSNNISCYVCNKELSNDDEKVVNILTDMTSRMNSVGNILGTIFKTSSVTWDSCYLCCACFVIIDRYDNLRAELTRIEAEMGSSLFTTQQEREVRFLFGNKTSYKPDKEIWLSPVSVSVTPVSASQDESQPVNQLAYSQH